MRSIFSGRAADRAGTIGSSTWRLRGRGQAVQAAGAACLLVLIVPVVVAGDPAAPGWPASRDGSSGSGGAIMWWVVSAISVATLALLFDTMLAVRGADRATGERP